MEDNLNFDLAHVTKKELNIAPVPSAISGEAKILNSRKNSVPENFGLSIRSNDSRVRKSSKGKSAFSLTIASFFLSLKLVI